MHEARSFIYIQDKIFVAPDVNRSAEWSREIDAFKPARLFQEDPAELPDPGHATRSIGIGRREPIQIRRGADQRADTVDIGYAAWG